MDVINKTMNYEERLHAMSERLAKINVSEMAQMAKDQVIESRLSSDYDNWTAGAKKAAIGAHMNRAKEAISAQAEAIRHYDISTTNGKWDVEKFLTDNGYIDIN